MDSPELNVPEEQYRIEDGNDGNIDAIEAILVAAESQFQRSTRRQSWRKKLKLYAIYTYLHMIAAAAVYENVIVAFAVKPEMRGKGHGAACFAKLRERLGNPDHLYLVARLEVTPFWNRIGFVIDPSETAAKTLADQLAIEYPDTVALAWHVDIWFWKRVA